MLKMFLLHMLESMGQDDVHGIFLIKVVFYFNLKILGTFSRLNYDVYGSPKRDEKQKKTLRRPL